MKKATGAAAGAKKKQAAEPAYPYPFYEHRPHLVRPPEQPPIVQIQPPQPAFQDHIKEVQAKITKQPPAVKGKRKAGRGAMGPW